MEETVPDSHLSLAFPAKESSEERKNYGCQNHSASSSPEIKRKSREAADHLTNDSHDSIVSVPSDVLRHWGSPEVILDFLFKENLLRPHSLES